MFSVTDKVGNLENDSESKTSTSSELGCSIEEQTDLMKKAVVPNDHEVGASNKKEDEPSSTMRFVSSLPFVW